MVGFTKLLSFVFLALSASAAPLAPAAKHATHRLRQIRDVKVETYHPKTTYQTFGKNGKETPQGFAENSLEDSTRSFVSSELGVESDKVKYTSGYTSKKDGSVSYSYARQMHDGVSFVNAVANVAYKNGKVIAFGSSFVDTSNIADSKPSIDVESVIPDIESKLGGTFNGFKDLKYLSKQDGSVALTHSVQIQNAKDNSWFEAYVDAHTGELLSLVDFVADATYTVLPITKQNLEEGQEELKDPEDEDSSPSGWSTDGATSGNNVVAYIDDEDNTATTFSKEYDVSKAPSASVNQDAARTNAFYLSNKVHDILYKYGFTEEAFNFQDDNFGNGGEGGDPVLISVQSSDGTDNANFATPPDGQSGQCNMFLWDYTDPLRDGSLENDIPVHELTHGLTNRLTGGGTGTCLQTTESGGLGEGWSDAVAAWTEQTDEEVKDFTMGSYVVDDPAGIRSYPYSTDEKVNPQRYSTVASQEEVHAIGEVWANTLYNVYAALVKELGFSKTAQEDASGKEGNVVYLHLLVDALALQPCNPTFTDARDAWIQADENRYDGANKCTLWNAFASRGLGVDAADYKDSDAVPDDC
ncbi:hypothetical protein CYLTODRAFT_401264 [Cylindrobasidium torrendii FP15055 ss-10]|uniref:Extracellular metalloproteinase n=1 Tax=Cylindrobasidium torrendii FP15055 ss-10 TaxID=1314674 RepID=A0A0D7B5T9_9AGAR|nr:hypothetical protein CYLTODRAFT_401264 [Cylindrobasidium torrendii FP15055 ss-10]